MSSLYLPPQRVTLTTAATIDPVTTLEAKNYLRLDTEDDDVGRLITAATTFLQDLTGRQFINATFTQYWDSFPVSGDNQGDHLELRILPVNTISSVKYIQNSDGVLTTWSSSSYQSSYTDPDTPCRIRPAYNATWPLARRQYDAIQCEFISGYGSTRASVPNDIKYAITLLVKHWYDEREPVGSASMIDISLRSLINKIRWDHS